MKTLTLLSAFTLLVGCGVSPTPYDQTAPGAPLPDSSFINSCREIDYYGRCTRWLGSSDMCKNPNALNPPAVPCASLKKK